MGSHCALSSTLGPVTPSDPVHTQGLVGGMGAMLRLWTLHQDPYPDVPGPSQASRPKTLNPSHPIPACP